MNRNLAPRFAAAAAAVLFGLASSGCASLLNPYVRAPELDAKGSAAAGVNAADTPGNLALQAAIDIAVAQRDAYYGAVGDRAKLRNGLPLLLVPLSVAAIYTGVAGSGSSSQQNLILGAGLVGAGAYGLGSFYTSTTREQVYLAGTRALSCSIFAVTPYYLPAELAKDIGVSSVVDLQRRIGNVQRQAQALRDEVARQNATTQGLAQSSRIAYVDPLLRRAQQSEVAARQVLQTALDLQTAVSGAGPRLRAAVENIVGQVNEQLSRLEPDLSAITTIVGGLQSGAQKFSGRGSPIPQAPASAPAGGDKAVGQASPQEMAFAQVQAAADKLASAVNDLDTAATTVQFAGDVIARRINAGIRLESCEVHSVKGRLDVSPSETAVDMRPGDVNEFIVRSTSGIPGVGWVGTVGTTSGQPVTMKRELAGNTLVVIVTYEKQVEGMASVAFEISDAGQEVRRTITLNLLPKALPQVSQPAAPRPPAGPKPAEGAPQAAGPKLDVAPADGTRNVFERELPAADRITLQTKLKVVPASGNFDEATRAAIKKWQEDNKWPGARDGTLTQAVFLKIMAS